MRRVLLERRHSRRYMRSRYGLDMGRRRILRKLRRPLTIEDTARRAFYYGNAMALEMAADAAMFTLDWLKDQINEAGKDLNDEDVAKFVGHRVANAAIGVMEALPLFHCAIMEKTSNPTIREVELYVLSGFAGAHISLLRFPRLRNAITRKELVEQLPEAVSRAVAERRLGEPLIRGRNSIRNRVSRFLEAQNKLSKEQTDFLELIEEDVMESVTMEASPPDKEIFELSEEAKAQFAEKVAQTDLSPRERSVLELKMEGYSQKEIAAKLNITTGTVKRLRARAYSKLRA